MEKTIFVLAGKAVSLTDLAMAGGAAALSLLLLIALSSLRAGRARLAEEAAAAERQREIDEKLAEMNRAHAEMTGRMSQMTEALAARQIELARLMSDRLDTSSRATQDHLGKLNERLAVIDAAQSRLTGLTQEVVGLKDILANKQTRGAFGQGRMEAIIRDALPAGTYEFQTTLSNRTRPDCAIRLPGDDRLLIVDAKFPLEGFAALREARDDEARRAALARARNDFGRHVKDIAEKYFIPGETQDIAILFVPSESIHADLHEHFDDLAQRASRSRILVVSPSLLMMAAQLMMSLVRDARMREEAHLIQAQVGRLVEDVRRLGERAGKLDAHFRQAQEDLSGVITSADKVVRRGQAIGSIETAPSEPRREVARAAE